MIKKIGYTLLTLVLLIVAAMIVIPWIYQDEIKQLLREEINRSVTATVDFEDISLSLFRHFPDVSLRIDGLKITEGKDSIAGDTLALANSIDLSMDVMTVIRKSETVQVNGVYIDQPYLNLIIGESGESNFNILVEDSTGNAETSEEGAFDIKLEDYSITEGRIVYHDRAGHIFLESPEFNHSGSGRFTGPMLHLQTSTQSPGTSYSYNGTEYLSRTDITADVDLDIDTDRLEYRISKAILDINSLNLNVEGQVLTEEDGYPMDLAFDAPGNDFSQLWSVVPEGFQSDLKNVQASGRFELNGHVKGKYNTNTGTLPAFDINLITKDGRVAYPELPQSIEHINADINYIRNEADNVNFINVRTFSFDAGQSTFRTRAELNQTPRGSRLNGFLEADLVLSDLPLTGGYSGHVTGDIDFDGNIEDVTRKAYDKLQLTGTASLSEVKIPQDAGEAMVINGPNITFSSRAITIPSYSIQQGETMMTGRADIRNPLGFLCPEVRPHLDLVLNSDYLDLDQWSSSETDEDDSGSAPGTTASLLPFDMTMNAQLSIGQVKYQDYDLSEVKGQLMINGQHVSIPSADLKYSGDRLSISGEFDGVADYLYNNGRLIGDMTVTSEQLDLNKLTASEDENAADESATDVVLPENMDLTITTDIDLVRYDGYSLNALKGDLRLSDQQLDLTELTTSAFGGRMSLLGSFKSNGREPAAFNFKYDISQMPVSAVYRHILSIRELVPLAEFVEGIFNSTLVVEGKLNKGMMPDLSSLTASGYIETLNGKLESLPFLDKLRDKIAVSGLRDITLEDTRNWFEIKDGAFILEPFSFTHDDIEIEVKGKTSLDRSIDLDLKFMVPKGKVDKLPGGETVGRGLDWVQKQVSGLGVNLGEINTYVFGVDVMGNILSPEIKINSVNAVNRDGNKVSETSGKGLKESLRDTLEGRKDEVVDETRKKVEEKLEEAGDSARKKAADALEKIGDEAKEKGKEVLDSSLNEEARKKAEEVLGEDADKKVEEMKKKLEEFNPFKKKKK